jgi:hypothetical protein
MKFTTYIWIVFVVLVAFIGYAVSRGKGEDEEEQDLLTADSQSSETGIK